MLRPPSSGSATQLRSSAAHARTPALQNRAPCVRSSEVPRERLGGSAIRACKARMHRSPSSGAPRSGLGSLAVRTR
eukprot:12306499-Alexandrium_andersonii.AAC.1